MVPALIPLLAAAEDTSAQGVNPWWVGGAVLAAFLLMLGILLVFGGGREHS